MVWRKLLTKTSSLSYAFLLRRLMRTGLIFFQLLNFLITPLPNVLLEIYLLSKLFMEKIPLSIFLLSPTRWFLHLVPSPTNGLKSIYLIKNISLLLVTKWQSKPTNQELLFPLFPLTIWSTSQQKISITSVLNLIKNSLVRLKLLKLYPLAVRLKLPKSWKNHPVFHVSELRPYHPPFIQSQKIEFAENGPVDDENSFEVEKIVRKRGKKYLVKWVGWPEEQNSWVDAKNLNCPELLSQFEIKIISKK